MTLQDLDKALRRKPGFNKAYAELEPAYALARQLIEWRLRRKLSQAQLAAKVGTTQSSIARLESGEKLPSLSFLLKVTKVLGVKVDIQLFQLKPNGREAGILTQSVENRQRRVRIAPQRR